MTKDDPPVRKTVSLPRSLWKIITEFRYDEHVKTEKDAVRKLIQIGLRFYPKVKSDGPDDKKCDGL